ncbi:MAG: hypothetical protein LBM93_07535 [Oscillospiraceae bacterium]|jgi:hypothetical protein|nr:hypothetical protein [Oscillospiraceae bacterium]
MYGYSSRIGVAGFILSIIGFLTGLILIGVLFDILAIIFCIIGFAKKTGKNGFNIAGLVIALVGLALTIVIIIIPATIGWVHKVNERAETQNSSSVSVSESKNDTISKSLSEEEINGLVAHGCSYDDTFGVDKLTISFRNNLDVEIKGFNYDVKAYNIYDEPLVTLTSVFEKDYTASFISDVKTPAKSEDPRDCVSFSSIYLDTTFEGGVSKVSVAVQNI